MAKKSTYQPLKKLTKKQKEQQKKGIIPDDFWNYGINPVLGYRNNLLTKRVVVENSQPVPNQLK